MIKLAKALLVGFLIGFLAAPTHAGTVTANSASKADVEAALATCYATSTPRLVLVPDGDVTWSGPVAIGKGQMQIRPVNMWGVTISAANGAFATSATNEVITIRGFVFNGQGSSVLLSLQGGGVCFNINQNEFQSNSVWHIFVGTANNGSDQRGPWGLISSNFTRFPTYPVGFTFVYGNEKGHSWDTDTEYGTTNCVVFESNRGSAENILMGAGFVDAHIGARVMGRRNMLTNLAVNTHGAESVGFGSNSVRWLDWHDNTFVWKGTGSDQPPYCFLPRGGTFQIYSNTSIAAGVAGISTLISTAVYCAIDPLCTEVGCVECWTYPDDYPGRQQIGQGWTGSAEGREPARYWNNTGTWTIGVVPASSDWVQDGVDIIGSAPSELRQLSFPHLFNGGTGEGGGGTPTPVPFQRSLNGARAIQAGGE